MSVNSGETTVTVSDTGAAGRARRWATPGMVITAATVLAFGVRLFTLTRPGFLTQPTEYDDGVYLGGAIRLTQGVLPYHDFAFVQPPGILLLMTPAALFARATSTVAGLALARVLTMLASVACVALAGLVRYRGTLVTGLTCFFLAVYPPDIASAHTLLLEPWMNLLCLLGATAAFRDGRVAGRTARWAWAGVALGFAATVKFWAGLPAAVLLIVLLLDAGRPRKRKVIGYVAGLAAGFLVPLLPFLFTAPGTFIRSTIAYQAARVGTFTPISLRLAHITGLGDVLNVGGHLTLGAGSNSLFAQSVVADTALTVPGVLAYVAFAVLVAVVAGGYLFGSQGRTPLEWFALAVAGLAVIAILSYSAFFYHYPAFPAPWLAIAGGVALGSLLQYLRGAVRSLAGGVVVLALAGAAILQLTQVGQARLPAGLNEFTSRIPAGACVVADETGLLIATNRFEAARPGCPVVIDALATTLVLTHGVSVQAGAAQHPEAVAAWQQILSKADYVWLSPNVWRRLPWHSGYAPPWFYQHFKQIWPAHLWVRGLGNLFERRS